jgi:hypothetical protein
MGSLLQYCKQWAFYSKTSHAMTMKPHEIDIRGYEECSVSITWPRCYVTSWNKTK